MRNCEGGGGGHCESVNDVLTELDRKTKRFKSEKFGKNTINRGWKTLTQPPIFFLICMKGVSKTERRNNTRDVERLECFVHRKDKMPKI